ncbi:MAG: adenylate kinase [Owenweeksia sp.]|nr:adenylate kinase [Owenweeksia sp.]
MLNIVLFGPPGAGKGTQSKLIVEKYQLVHLSTGDLLRSEITAGTELGLKAKSLMDAGKLVPDKVVIGMISHKLDAQAEARGFIFDGFPRTDAQARSLDELLKERSQAITTMVSLEVPEEELIARLLERGKESGRSDDQNEEVIKDRLQVYQNQTAILKKYYDQQGKLKTIDGQGTIDEVFNRIGQAIAAADVR